MSKQSKQTKQVSAILKTHGFVHDVDMSGERFVKRMSTTVAVITTEETNDGSVPQSLHDDPIVLGLYSDNGTALMMIAFESVATLVDKLDSEALILS